MATSRKFLQTHFSVNYSRTFVRIKLPNFSGKISRKFWTYSSSKPIEVTFLRKIKRKSPKYSTFEDVSSFYLWKGREGVSRPYFFFITCEKSKKSVNLFFSLHPWQITAILFLCISDWKWRCMCEDPFWTSEGISLSSKKDHNPQPSASGLFEDIKLFRFFISQDLKYELSFRTKS